MRSIVLVLALMLTSGGMRAARGDVVVWAWERPEALATLPPSYRVAAVIGFIALRGDTMIARGRRFPLTLESGRAPPIGVVHIEIDPAMPLDWTAALRAQVVAASLAFARGYGSVQIDMEVRASQREALLDVLRGVRAGLPAGTTLSMTALASWCDTESWLAAAPVDEIVPMLFRMGHHAGRLRAKLASGGDFGESRCRTALGISVDTPAAFPPGRRVYVFNPRSWDAAAVAALVDEEAR